MPGETENFVVVVPHTHWDREWYLPLEAFRMKLVKLLDGLFDILEADPDEAFHMDGQTIVLDDYEEIRGKSERLRKFVREGRIAIGPWYVQPDEFLPSGEALIRNLQLGINMSSKWGKPVMVGYLPDMFGHIGQMPQILDGLGIKNAILWRGVPPSIDKCGFEWSAPDGTKLLTGFMPMSYSSGFNLPDDAEELKGRVVITRALMGRLIEGRTWLLMAGTDHQQPKFGLSKLLKAAFADMPGWELKIGSLEEYFERLETESVARPSATGEMRDPHYAPILPGTASTRMYLKRRDFRTSSLIERYAEPLAAWAWALGGEDHRDFLAYAWKLLLQNHPHDSICGCSVDEVHREMMTRYEKMEIVTKRVLNEAAIELGGMMKIPSGKNFGIWKPTGKNMPVPVTAEIDGKPPKSAELVAPDGKSFPLQTLEVLEKGELINIVDVPAIASPLAMAFLFQEEEMLGGYMVRTDLKLEKQTLRVVIGIGRSPAGFDFKKAKKKAEDKLAKSGAQMLKVEVRTEPRVKVASVVDDLSPFSLGPFQIRKRKGDISTDLKSGDRFIENSHWRVEANDGGTLTIHDLHNNATFKNALRFVDEGDRGDEYTFEPIEGDKPIDEPEKVRVRNLYNGPVAVGMRIESAYRIPAQLDSSGKKRSKRSVAMKIITDIVLYDGVRWIDFRTRFINFARDHRLRVLFEAPFSAEEFFAETAFEVARRKACVTPQIRKPDTANLMSLLIGPETEVGFGPHRGFAALENGSVGMALFNRGLPEIEVVKGEEGAATALTLLRSVGAISRDDLSLRSGHAGPPIATPGAQCLGEQVCEFASMSYKGVWQEVDLPALAHSWRHAPLMFPIPGGGDKLEPGDAPLEIDNPAIEIRALQPAPDGSKALCARIYNTTDRPQTARLNLHTCFKNYDEANLMGNTIENKHITRERSNTAIVKLPPAGIITLRLEFSKA